MASIDPCNLGVLLVTNWLDDLKMEIKLNKLDNLELDAWPKKMATFGKPNNAKLDPKSNYTFDKGI
jgi:hypothetical protein